MMYVLTQEEYDTLRDKNIAEQVEAEVNKRLRRFGKYLDKLLKEVKMKPTSELLQMSQLIQIAMKDTNIPEASNLIISKAP